jgi:cytochrome P450
MAEPFESFDPFVPFDPADGFDRMQRLREQAPVVELAPGMHYVTRYAEAQAVLRDTEHFSSAAGFRAPGVEVPHEDRMLGEQDDPQHARTRRVIMSGFRPSVIRAEEAFIRSAAKALVADLDDLVTVDLVAAYAVPLPMQTTVHLLGFPLADAPRIAEWSKEVMESDWPAMNRTDRGDGMPGAFPEYTAYVDDHVANVRRELADGRPRETLIDRLVAPDDDADDAETLSGRQIRSLVFNLLLGGMTTTSQLLGNVMFELLHGGLVDSIDPGDVERIDNLVDESMRTRPPVLFIPRGCTDDVEIGGHTVRAGERVIVGTASANRDRSVFPDGEHLDVDRVEAGRHLTFGFGPHTCAGATMARLTGRIGTQEFLAFARRRNARLEPEFTYENVPTYFECGPRGLPVVLHSGRE